MADNSKEHPYLATIAFVAVSIAWGTTYAAIKWAVEGIPPFALAGIRFTIAGALLMAFLALRGRKLPTLHDWKVTGVSGLLLLCAGNGLVCWAEKHVESVFAALLINVGPFMFVGLTALAGDHPPRKAWLGLWVGMAGLVLMVSEELLGLLRGTGIEHGPNFWWSIAALMIAPFTWSAGSIYVMKHPPACGKFMMVAGQCLAGGLGSLVVAALAGEIGAGHLRALAAGEYFAREVLLSRHVLSMFYLIVVGSWIGYAAYMYCVVHLPAHKTATTTYINNVFAVLTGWIVLGESLTAIQIAGGAVILAGVWIVNAAKHKKA